MTAVEARLAEIEARAAAATEGPWRVTPWHDKGVMPAGWADDSLPIDKRGPFAHIAASDLLDAAFIAAARTDVPALTAALRAVLAVHAPMFTDHGWVCVVCHTALDDRVPDCPTVAAIAAALGVTP